MNPTIESQSPIGQMALDFPGIKELDINLLVGFPKGQKALVLHAGLLFSE